MRTLTWEIHKESFLWISGMSRKKNIPHTWAGRRWDTITKPSFSFQLAKRIMHFQSDEDLVMKALWANVTTSRAAFLFSFSPLWPDYPLTLDTYWTFNGPHTHTHRHHHHHHLHPYLFWDLTPPPRDDNTTQPSRAGAYAACTGAWAYRTLPHSQTRTPEVSWLCLYWHMFPQHGQKVHSHTLEWTSCCVFTVGLSFHTEIWKILNNFTCQQAWFHLKINDYSVTICAEGTHLQRKQTLAFLTKQVLTITENSEYTTLSALVHCLHSGPICIYL